MVDTAVQVSLRPEKESDYKLIIYENRIPEKSYKHESDKKIGNAVNVDNDFGILYTKLFKHDSNLSERLATSAPFGYVFRSFLFD